MGFKIATFQHVLEGYKVAKEIAAHGAGASTFSDWWAYKIEAYDAIPYNAAIMTRKGVLRLGQLRQRRARAPPEHRGRQVDASTAASREDEALALVTINPAKQLRIDKRVGSLEAGKDADVVVWNHHPLSTYAIAERVYIDGTLYYDRVGRRRATDRAARRRSRTSSPPRAAGRGRAVTGTEPATTSASVGRTRADASAQHLTPCNARPSRRVRAGRRPHGRCGRSRTRRSIRSRSRRSSAARSSIRGNQIEAIGANVQVPAGAQDDRRRGRGCLSRASSTRAPTSGSTSPAPRGFEDVNEMLDFNPQLRTRVAYHADSDADPGRARERHHDGRGRAGRRHLRRRSRGDEPRRLDVGGSDAPAERRHRVQLPEPRRRRRPRWRWRRRAAAAPPERDVRAI